MRLDVKFSENKRRFDCQLGETINASGILSITENGRHNVKAYEYADVNVPYPSGNITITENGTHDVLMKENAIVNVPEKSIFNKGLSFYAGVLNDGAWEDDSTLTDTEIYFDGLVTINRNCSYSFDYKNIKKAYFPHLTTINGNVYYMFHGANLEEIYIDKNVSTNDNKSYWFYYCTYLKKAVFNGDDYSNFNITSLFENCGTNGTGIEILFPNAKKIGNFYSFCSYCKLKDGAAFPFENVEKLKSLNGAFRQAQYVPENIHFRKLDGFLAGGRIFSYSFYYTRAKTFTLDSLEYIGDDSNYIQYCMFDEAFYNCPLDEFRLPRLKEVKCEKKTLDGTRNTRQFSGAYYRNSSYPNAKGEAHFPELTSVKYYSSDNYEPFYYAGFKKFYFPKLTNIENLYTYSSSQNLFFRETRSAYTAELHFGIENQSAIEALPNYSSKFGHSYATICFDLVNHITYNGEVYDRYGDNYLYYDDAPDGISHFSWKKNDDIIYTTEAWTPEVGDSVYSRSADDTFTAIGTITAVS